MPVVIGGKVIRNVPEQVSKNAEDIKKIFQTLDGLNIQDNLVVVEDMSQILTPAELEIVEKEVAFISYDGQLYIKKEQDSSEAKFDIVFTISGSTVITLNSKEIIVTLNTGALGAVLATYTLYSKSQIDTLLSDKADVTYVDTELAKKADLTGANFTGSITAPSIIEDMNGYSIVNIDSIVDDLIYASACKNGNKITFVVFGTITPAAQTNYNLLQFVIPSSVGEKLYPFTSGSMTNLLEVKYANCFIDSTAITQAIMRVRKTSNTTLTFELRAQPLTPNTTYHLRFEVTFLLSDDLSA